MYPMNNQRCVVNTKNHKSRGSWLLHLHSALMIATQSMIMVCFLIFFNKNKLLANPNTLVICLFNSLRQHFTKHVSAVTKYVCLFWSSAGQSDQTSVCENDMYGGNPVINKSSEKMYTIKSNICSPSDQLLTG